MKNIAWLLATFWAFSAVGEALLPPLYQGVSEVKSILASHELGEKLHAGERLITIQKNEAGYEITTNQHRLQIDVIYAHPAKIGPAEFKLHFQDPVAIP